MITREADYALRVVLYLSGRRGDPDAGPVSAAEVAREMDIPYRFLRKLINRLVRVGLLVSRRGKGGGIALRRPPARITLLQVANAMAPAGVKLNACIAQQERCNRAVFCPVHRALAEAQRTVDRRLNAVTFARLCAAAARSR